MAFTKKDFARAIEFGDVEGLMAGIEMGWGRGAICPETGCTALMAACVSGWEEGAKELLPASEIDAVDNRNSSALMWAAFSGRLGILKMLIKAGARVDGRDSDGNSALGLAAACGRCEAMDQEEDSSEGGMEKARGCIQELLPLLDIDEENFDGETPRSLIAEACDERLSSTVEEWEVSLSAGHGSRAASAPRI